MRRVVVPLKLLQGAVLMTENTLFTERAIFLFGKLSAIHQSEAVAIAGNALLGELSL